MGLKSTFSSISFGASVDQQTGSLSVFEIIEELRIPQVPFHLQSLVLTVAMEKTQPEEFQGKVMIHILTPDGRQQIVGNGEIRIPPEQKRMKAVFRFGGFPITQFGQHRFVLSWVDKGGAKVGEVLMDFDATQVTQVAQGLPPNEKPPLSH